MYISKFLLLTLCIISVPAQLHGEEDEFSQEEWTILQKELKDIRYPFPKKNGEEFSVKLADIYDVSEDYALSFSEKDDRKKIAINDSEKSAEFVRFNKAKWIDGLTIWCFTGETDNAKPDGFAVLDLLPDCKRTETMVVNFSNGVIDGKVAIFLAGNLVAEGSIVNGKKEDVWTEYSVNGVITFSQNYRNGSPASGPLIIGKYQYPLFHGFNAGGVVNQFIGQRDSNGLIDGYTVPVSFKQKDVDTGTEYSFQDHQLTISSPEKYTATFTMKTDPENDLLYASGACVIVYANGTENRGSCTERTDQKNVYRYISGQCEVKYPNGNLLKSNCDENGLVPGTNSYLTGPGIDTQWVTIKADHGFSYKVPGKFKKVRRGIGGFLKGAIKTYHDPETWFNPEVWEDNGQRVIREFNRVMDKNPNIAKALAKACGPETGGCNYTSHIPATAEHFRYQTRKNPSSSRVSISATTSAYRSFASTYSPDHSDAVDAVKFFWGAFQLVAYNDSLNAARQKIAYTLKPGESLQIECVSQYARVLECRPYDGGPSFRDPNKTYSIGTVYGKTAISDMIPEPESVKANRKKQIMESLPTWIKNADKIEH